MLLHTWCFSRLTVPGNFSLKKVVAFSMSLVIGEGIPISRLLKILVRVRFKFLIVLDCLLVLLDLGRSGTCLVGSTFSDTVYP